MTPFSAPFQVPALTAGLRLGKLARRCALPGIARVRQAAPGARCPALWALLINRRARASVYKVRIRGIFATALTKLALDWGFKIVQPTAQVLSRFGLEPDYSPPDLTVKDHESRSGVVLVGECGAVELFLARLRERADAIVTRAAARYHEVFVGSAVREGRVEAPGKITLRVPGNYVVQPGSVGIFTVVKPPVGPLEGVAVPEIIVEGNLVELNTTGRVTFSAHIPEHERLRLRILAGTRLRNYANMGLHFKSSARYADDESIAREAEQLYQEMLRISQGGLPGTVLRHGKCVALALFDKYSKERLDEARAAVVVTIRGHHALRAQELGECLDILDHAAASTDIYDRVAEYLARGDVTIYHIKPWGEVIKMGGRAIKRAGDVLVVRRALKPGGTLDGLGIKIERGFYALTCIPKNANYIVHSYYTAEGKNVGTYVNLNTTPEWGRYIIYIDLLADKVYGESGAEMVLDTQELSKHVDELPERLRDPLRFAPPRRVLCTENGLVEAPPAQGAGG